jgi:hypothetical protein
VQTSRRELLDDFLDSVNNAGDVSARNLAERLLNRALESIWLKHDFLIFLMPTAFEFATVAGTRTYALPDYFGRVSGVSRTLRNLTTGAKLWPRDLSDLQETDPTVGTSFEIAASPSIYAMTGTTGVQLQPATAGEALEAVSDSAADVAVRVYLEGLNSLGQYTRTQVTLNGVAPVALGVWKTVQKFAKAYPDGVTPTTELTSSEGIVILRTVAAGTELQRLYAEESAREVPQLTLYHVPDAVYTMAVPILRAPERVTRDADPLPPFWTNALMEEMTIHWRVGDRDAIVTDGTVPRPHFADLVMNDNAARAQAFRRRQPFSGY